MMKKIILSVILILTLTVSLFGISVSAASSELIDSAVIDAVINTDGTVNVTEKWTVSYITASDCFYRHFDIYSADSALTLVQKYGEIKDVAVKIDGKAVPEADRINAFSFVAAENGKSYVLTVNCPSAQTTREYELSYTMTDSVKKKGGDAIFSYMVLGKEFLYTSNNVQVNVHFPEGAEEIQPPESTTANGNELTATFVSERVYDTFAVEASCDKDVFESGALVSYSTVAEGMSKAGSALVKALPVISVIILIVVIILFVLLPDKLIRLPREKSAKKLLKKAEDGKVYTLPESVTACESFKIVSPVSRINPKASAKKVPALFAMAILECIEKGFIVPDGDKLIVGTPSQPVPTYIMSVLNFLKTFAGTDDDRYVIDKDFADKVNAECMSRYDIMANYLATFYSLIKGADFRFFRNEKNKEAYESIYAVKATASAMKHKSNFAQCMGEVLSGRKTSEAEIFAMLYSSTAPDKMFAKGGRTGESALCEALNAMYNVYIKSK